MSTPGLTPRRKRGLLTSAVPASVFAKRVTRKDAHRWGSLPNTSGPTCVSDDIATRRRLAIKAECRKGPLCLWPQLDIALNRHHCLSEVGRPALWRSPCTLASILSGNGAIFAPCWLVTPLGPCMATDPCGTTSGTGGCESFSGGSARSRPTK